MFRFLFAAAPLLIGCGSAPDGGAPPDCDAACYSARFFDGYSRSPVPDCGEAPAVGRAAAFSVSLFRGASVTEANLLGETRALARYYAENGVSFVTGAAPEVSSDRFLITGSHEELARALDRAGIPRSETLTPEEQQRADRVTAEVLFGRLTAFLLDPPPSEQAAFKLGVFEQVVDPSFMRDLGLTGEVSGFGFSPTLFRRLRESGKDLGLVELLELPEEFTPSALLAHVPLAAMPYPDNAVAHEVGHARGLVHTSDPSNLMHPNVGAYCRAALTSDQLDALAGLVAPEQPNAGSSAARAADAQLGVLLDVHRSATLQALEWRAAEAGSK